MIRLREYRPAAFFLRSVDFLDERLHGTLKLGSARVAVPDDSLAIQNENRGPTADVPSLGNRPWRASLTEGQVISAAEHLPRPFGMVVA